MAIQANKRPPKSWNNRAPLNWGTSTTPVVSPTSPAEDPMMRPTEFGEIAPVARPTDVPELTEEIPQQVRDNSLLSGFFNIMDNIVPDDMGGLVRGESGWINEVPYVGDIYENTAGRVLGAGLSIGETTLNAVNWGSEQMNHLGAALFSAMPGGIQTLDWEQSQDISLGQVATANAVINNSNGIGGWLINAATLQMPFAGLAAIGANQDPENVLYSEDFDILNEEERKEAFESGGMGQITSGFADAIWMVAADPTILGGKATNIIRLGTKTSEFGGLSNQALRTTGQLQRWSNDVNEQATLIKELGVDGARSSDRLTAQGEQLIAAMEGNADQLAKHPWVKDSPNQRDTRALLGATDVSKPEEAAALAGAMAGNAESWTKLRDLNVNLYVDTAQAMGVDVFAPVGDAVFDTARAGISMTDNQANLLDDLVYERAAERPELFPNINLRDMDLDPASLAAGQMITRAGSRLGPRTVRAANAWRSGATRSQFDNNAFKKSSSSATSTSSRGHYVYDIIEGISGSRPLQVVRWVGRGTPTGVISTKNGPDSAMVLRDVTSWLRKSPIDAARSAEYVNRYAAARTVGDRTFILREMETEAAVLIAQRHGVSVATAQKAYDGYASKRAAIMGTVKKTENAVAVDPDTGMIVKVPEFYAELEPSYAMMDTKVFNRVIGGNRSWMRTVDEGEFIADELNKYWKLSVLLRLGYTQRNIAEGALRSFAVLGLVAANPTAFANAPGNAIKYAGARRVVKKARNENKALMTSYENLLATRKLLDEGLGVARYDEMIRLRNEAEELYSQIQSIRGRGPAGASLPATPLTKKQRKEIDALEKKRNQAVQKAKGIEENFYRPMLPELNQSRASIKKIQEEIDDVASRIEELMVIAREKTSGRKRGGYQVNVVDGQPLQGAFQGAEGAIAARLSSADRTTIMAIDSTVARSQDALENSVDFKVIDPKKLEPNQLPIYFDEYAIRINYRYREDPIGRMILENRSIGEIKAWLYSDAGSSYMDNLSISGRRLDSEEAIDGWLDHLVRRLDNEMPTDTNLRALALKNELTPTEVAAALRGRELPTIVGRIADDMPASFPVRGKRGVDMIADKLMIGLGSFPETKLLRHPFYNRVYMDRQAQLWRLASDQGVDMASPIVKNRINKSSHQSAMKATRETMYTIEELSNAAVMLRYISPFFPAFENSLRTWGRIAWNNPAVIGYGNILWNIPNGFGWVVDEDGIKVERSNFMVDEGHYIVWPESVANIMKKALGPFDPGERLRTRQMGLNLINQGGQWWFSGAGPATAISLSWLLRGKPEDTEIIRNFVGEEVFMQLVPSGNPNADLVDALLPTFGRRVKQMLAGESTDQAFLTTWNQIVEDEYIAAQLEGRPFTEKDAQRTKEKADKFWGFQIAAALVLPAQSSIMSRFQVERDYWGTLIDNQELSYPEKIDALNKQFPEFGDSLLAITRAGSYTETKLQPNLTTWSRIYKNKDIVDDLYALDPELVGMFGNMGSFDDPFSRAVYGEFGSMKIGPNDARVRRQMKPDEIIRNNQIKDGWSEYWKVKDYIEDKAISLGYSSLQVDDAKPLRDIIDKAAIKITDQYPAWGEERRTYEDKLDVFIQGARRIVQNAELVNEDSTISALREYLQTRDMISEKLSDENDPDIRKSLKLIGYKAAFDLRQMDIGFADFYDQYLDRDDFRKL